MIKRLLDPGNKMWKILPMCQINKLRKPCVGVFMLSLNKIIIYHVTYRYLNLYELLIT